MRGSRAWRRRCRWTQQTYATDKELTTDRGDGLEYVGSLERIALSFRNISTEDVERVWPEIMRSGFVERVTDAVWHVALVLAD